MHYSEFDFSVGIDKVELGLPFPNVKSAILDTLSDYEANKIAVAQKLFFARKLDMLRHLKEDIFRFVKLPSDPYFHRYLIKAPDETDAFEFRVGQRGHTPILNLRFNPSKITPKGKTELKSFLDLSFNYGYDEFIRVAVVSKIEFFFDVCINNLNYKLIDFGRREVTIRDDGTEYFGKRNSVLTMASYDKADQLKLDTPLWRYEARIKDRNRTFYGFIESPPTNPFQPFIVIEKSKLQSIANDHGIPKLPIHLQTQEFFRCVKNKHARKILEHEIRTNKAEWWQCDDVYQLAVAELKKFRLTSAIFSLVLYLIWNPIIHFQEFLQRKKRNVTFYKLRLSISPYGPKQT